MADAKCSRSSSRSIVYSNSMSTMAAIEDDPIAKDSQILQVIFLFEALVLKMAWWAMEEYPTVVVHL